MRLRSVLARKPEIVLIDEFAHTNAPGSRHPKRYMDVEELLAAGIDVYSTINIQHVESLNDVVASFTKVRVRETVRRVWLHFASSCPVQHLWPPLLARMSRAEKGPIPSA